MTQPGSLQSRNSGGKAKKVMDTDLSSRGINQRGCSR